jgi:translation initiation factor eIF-2B subunit delta
MCINLFSEKIAEIKSDRSSGASQIARNALAVLRFFVQTSKTKSSKVFVTEFTELGRQLFEARPNMAPVQNLVAQIVYEINSLKQPNLDLLQSFALSKIDELLQLSESAVKESAKYAADLIADSDYVSTCSYSSTICEVFKTAKNQGKHFKVFVAESKTADNQFRYGHDLATFLASIHVPVHVFPDSIFSVFVPKTNLVLVGADSVLSDGSIINGTPTREVAFTAKKSDVPFYCVCETAKVNTLSYLGKKVKAKQGFDVVPSDFLSGVITENGILNTKNIIDLMKEKAKFLEIFSVT